MGRRTKEGVTMPTSSITKRFVIKDDEVCEKLVNAINDPNRKKREVKYPDALETGRAMLKAVSSSIRALENVRSVLKRFRIPAYRYSVGSEEEEKDNLFYENGHLMVIYVERGGRCFEKSYDNIDEACMMFFTRVIDSKIKRWWAIRYYRRLRLRRVRQHAARL